MKINELFKSFAICAAIVGCGDYQESQDPAVVGSNEEAITLKNSGWGVLTELSGADDGQTIVFANPKQIAFTSSSCP